MSQNKRAQHQRQKSLSSAKNRLAGRRDPSSMQSKLKVDLPQMNIWVILLAGALLAVPVWPLHAQEENDGGPAKKEFSDKVNKMFMQGQFAQLEQMERELRETKAKWLSGGWKLSGFWLGLHPGSFLPKRPSDSEQPWQEWFGRLAEWEKQLPDSVVVKLAHAEALVSFAWKARGCGWASTVTEEGWRLFRLRLRDAEQRLESFRAQGTNHPEWYCTMMDVALGQCWPRERFDRLFSEALVLEPLYYDFYYAKAYYLLPRWHGREGEWEHFAETSAEATKKELGMALYTRICWANAGAYHSEKLFTDSAVKWEKMREGFRDLLKQTPASGWNRSAFCYYACLAGDKAAARELFQDKKTRFYQDLWLDQEDFDERKAWALSE